MSWEEFVEPFPNWVVLGDALVYRFVLYLFLIYEFRNNTGQKIDFLKKQKVKNIGINRQGLPGHSRK